MRRTGQRCLKAAGTPRRWWRRKLDFECLAAMEDWQLRDLGLDRRTIADAERGCPWSLLGRGARGS
ncbi:DUF1127 domain-containing protein [Faunimonas pinastri]|nr:DUF1127 domain-containing protein [Faunimonas pinastri]